MSEPSDLDQITALEHRITAALDRIAQGVAARGAGAGVGAQGEDAGGDAGELAERVAALSAALEETQGALAAEQAAHAELSDRLRAVEAARKADADEAAREIARAKESAPAMSEADIETMQALEAEVERRQGVEDVLRRRIQRLREERNALQEERTEAREQLDEVQGKLDQLEAIAGPGGGADKELTRLRQSNSALRDTIEEMREGIGNDAVANGDLVTAALAAELESLRAERAVDAAEARAILAEIRPVLDKEGSGANA